MATPADLKIAVQQGFSPITDSLARLEQNDQNIGNVLANLQQNDVNIGNAFRGLQGNDVNIGHALTALAEEQTRQATALTALATQVGGLVAAIFAFVINDQDGNPNSYEVYVRDGNARIVAIQHKLTATTTAPPAA